jgi:flagellin
MNIALIAHDSKKELMTQFCIAYCGILSKHSLCATGTTGKLVAEATGLDIERYLSGSQGGAQQSITKIDEAIAKVSKQRSLLGAVQNRLEHTIANLDNTAENLQAAESGIRDVDMAAEMVTMSKYNILQQAGQSMLAQANQATQGVLSLLQG